MNWEDLKNKGQHELRELLSETRNEIRSLLFQAHNRNLKEVHKIALAKKTVARIAMLLKEKSGNKLQ